MRKSIEMGRDFVHESVVGAIFTGTLSEETAVAGIPAVQPHITGSAWITKYSEVVLDPTDPFQTGYRVADIW